MQENPDSSPAARLKMARKQAGFSSAREAAERFGWNVTTYQHHENGTRGIGRAATRYARAYGVPASWLQFGQGAEGARPESSVLPFDLVRDGPKQPAHQLISIARAMGHGAGRGVWRVANDSMVSAGYLSGDYILVDLGRGPVAEDGDTVLIALNDLHIGHAINSLAHYAPPFAIVLGGHAGHITTHRIDNEAVEIKGVVTASWRFLE